MFTNKAKQWILKEVKLEELNQKIQYLEMALEISENLNIVSNLQHSIADQINAFVEKDIDIELDTFEKVAQFLEVFIYLKNPQQFNEISLNKNGENIPTYLRMLGAITEKEQQEIFYHYKQQNYFKPNSMLSHYARCYQLRNELAHQDVYRNKKEVWECIDSILTVYLTIPFMFCQKLKEESNILNLSQQTNAKDYIQKVIYNYEHNKRKAFKYIPLEALNEKCDKDTKKESLITLIDKENKVKVIGLAGIGKSTTLEYLAYRDAKNFHGIVPILIELKNITDTDNGILKEIKSILSCEEEIAIELLNNGYIHLYLDGVNEILLKDNEKQLIINEIDVMIGRYPKTKIIITDRESNKLTISENIPTYIIQPLTNDQIENFINGNCDNKELAKKVSDILFQDEKSFLLELVRIPFMLQNLIEIVRIDGEIPTNQEEFAKNFLEAILKREIKEKATPESLNLDSYLIAIALADNDKYDRTTLLKIISNTTNELHLSNVYSDKVLDLILQLHIMEECEFLVYQFVDERYKNYFLIQGLKTSL